MSLTLDIPTLTTERLILRIPEARDFDAVAQFYSEPRSEGFGGVISRDQSWRWFASNIGHFALRGYGFWMVETKAGEPIGMVGLWYPEGWPEPEIGWFVHTTTLEGKGYAREAAEAMRAHAYGPLGFTTLISLIVEGNERSANLATRLGAWYEADWTSPTGHVTRIFRHPAPGEVPT